MTYQPQQPPVMPGYPAQPPQGAWAPPATKKRGPLPWLIGALVASILLVAGLLAVLFMTDANKPQPKAPVLTEAGAQRACRTAFGQEWKDRAKRVTADGDAVTSVQGIEMQETVKTTTGFMVNGTVHFTLTTGILAPVEDTL
jgi:hypothetical protein